MRIVILSEAFSKNMGYLENCLPKYFARLGADVHIVTMALPPYYQLSDFKETYADFSSHLQENVIESHEDGYILHIIPHVNLLGYKRMVGLAAKLKSLRPDIVQTTAAIGWIPLDVAILKLFLGYKLFTGSHTAASVFPLARKPVSFFNKEMIRCLLTRTVPGRLVSLLTKKCYAVTIDCADIAQRFFGVQKRKIEIMHLGVDTDFFFPPKSLLVGIEREEIRKRFGFSPTDIVCIYTGKLTTEKNALIVARAIDRLRESGEPYVGLFIGEGVQREEIQAYPACTVLPFMPFNELAPYYRAADIGVWPTNESTSMLDAAACGIPLIVSDGIVYRDHVTGNGLVYKMNDLEDLVSVLLRLRGIEERMRLGTCGARKMASGFSWESVARRRMKDYETALHEGSHV